VNTNNDVKKVEGKKTTHGSPNARITSHKLAAVAIVAVENTTYLAMGAYSGVLLSLICIT